MEKFPKIQTEEFPSINFTYHHRDLLQAFAYPSELKKDTFNKGIQNLKNYLENNEAPRLLYVIKSGRRDYYKIGITNNLAIRIQTLQIGNPDKLEVIAYALADMGDFLGREIIFLENFLHLNYANEKVHGEWFKLSQEEIADICIFLIEECDLETLLNEKSKSLSVYYERLSSILEDELW
ncbi:MAG: GIY-YIG nuclease family protein [Cyclobacteriaceae bacterium]